ncbi:WD40_repeat protein [Hexamita inflata]|uniref:WD40_repeat protein n=1 Tax=Hexamita inflata TaxID=28002 RepID=A0ABP1H9D7_9EUKA
MSDTLLTIETEGTVTAVCASPTNSLQLCYATIIKNFVIRELVPPEQLSDSEIDSEDIDFENKLKPHSEVIFKQVMDDVIRQIHWDEKEIVLAMRSKVLICTLSEEESVLKLNEKTSIDVKQPISKMLVSDDHYIIGTDEGDIFVFKRSNTLKPFKHITDAADYISDMDLTTNCFAATSGDGSVYIYDENFKKLDSNATEDFDFTAVRIIGDKVVVGTNNNRILIYKVDNAALPCQIVKQPAEIEFIQRYQNFFLVGLSSGQLRGLLEQPLKDIGIMATTQKKPLMVGAGNCDQSLFYTGGADNRIFVLNFGWLLDEGEQGAADIVHEGLQNGIGADQGFIPKNEPEQIVVNEEEEEENEESELTELAELSSDVTDSDDSDEENGKYVKKIIKPGHLASDSSFSDFFKFEKTEKSKKQKTREGTYGKGEQHAEKKEFFKGL